MWLFVLASRVYAWFFRTLFPDLFSAEKKEERSGSAPIVRFFGPEFISPRSNYPQSGPPKDTTDVRRYIAPIIDMAASTASPAAEILRLYEITLSVTGLTQSTVTLAEYSLRGDGLREFRH